VRVAFFGLPLAGVLLAGDGHEIVYAAACRPAPGLRRLTARVGRDRTVVRPDLARPEAVARIRAARPDLIVSWFWTTKLPAEVLALAPAVGVHPSLLPRHRGPDPYFWAIDEGDATTGVTAHLLEAEYDTGPVLGRRELPIEPGWNSWNLARALDRPGLALLRDTVRAFASGKPPAAVAQVGRATFAPQPGEGDLAIRWSWTASRIERRVRAAAPWPGAWTQIGEALVTLERVRETRRFPRALEPGEAAVREDGVAVVRAGDAAVELLAGRDEEDAHLRAPELAAVVALARAAAARSVGG
jgi:methionyl-tRNA formyltransferase